MEENQLKTIKQNIDNNDDDKQIISSSEDEILSEDYDFYFNDESDEEEQKMSIQIQKLSNIVNRNEGLRATHSQLKEIQVEINNQIKISVEEKKIANPLKKLVSKQKKRFDVDGFNLDLSYITHNIIAMGFPAESYESFYRNSMNEVVRFFNSRHMDHYKIYNLCSERKYPKTSFNGNFIEFPFDDHQAPTFDLIYKFCLDLDKFLKLHPNNVAGIHCKAGKGRTGVMICCYLLWSKLCQHAYDALKFYGLMRTKNEKGVTIPSQIRYVLYFEKALKNKWQIENFPQPELELVKIKLLTVPQFNVFGGCEPWFKIYEGRKQEKFISTNVFPLKQYKSEASIDFNINNLKIKGDVLIEFYNHAVFKKAQKMFAVWFNCAFFDLNGKMVIEKYMLDRACKDKKNKKFSKDFHVEIHARQPPQNQKTKLIDSDCSELNFQI